MIQKNQSECLVLLRYNESLDKRLLILINLDCENFNEASWKRQDADIKETILFDLITGAQIKTRKVDDQCVMRLTPGAILALTPDLV